MSLFARLTEKPWVTVQGPVEALPRHAAFSLPTPKIGLRTFLAVVTVVFTLLAAAYAHRMAHADWRALPEPWLLWPNTAVLVLSSVAWQWARASMRRRRIEAARAGLLAGGALALVFLVGQLLAWQQLAAAGYFAAENPANAFFYLLTALHGLHLAGGLVAWARTSARAWRGVATARLGLSVELCTVYWHFLLVVWLALFGLLLLT